MPRTRRKRLDYSVVDLDGVRYAILREALLKRLCRLADVECFSASQGTAPRGNLAAIELDEEQLARRLIARRRRVGLTQAELARRAGIRVETLNRVERGKTTPDFSTVRKLVAAMNEAEAETSDGELECAADTKERRHASSHKS